MDFSWCNSDCSSAALPKFGCVDAGQKLGFTIKNLGSYVLDPYGKENKPGAVLSLAPYPYPGNIPMPNPEDPALLKYRETVKRHILEKGPILGMFIVPKNFMTPDPRPYASTEDIFLEVNEYTSPTTYNYRGEIVLPDDMEGGHAVSIVGWGISDKAYKYTEGKDPARIPYWLVRNSWSPAWGDKGFFKMPMYPYNRVVQFDRQVPVPTGSNQAISVGGHYFVEADSILKETYDSNGIQMPADRSSFFKTDVFDYDKVEDEKKKPKPSPEPTPEPPTPTPSKDKKKGKISIWEWTTLILAVAVLAAVGFAVFTFIDSRGKVVVQPGPTTIGVYPPPPLATQQAPSVPVAKIFEIKTVRDLPPAVKPMTFSFF